MTNASDSVWHCSRYQHLGEHCHGHWFGFATLPPEEVPEVVHQVSVSFPPCFLLSLTLCLISNLCVIPFVDNYIVAGALDGGTQVISFILNLAVFGAVGNAHAFPEWWGNDLSAYPLPSHRFLSTWHCRHLRANTVPAREQTTPPTGVSRLQAKSSCLHVRGVDFLSGFCYLKAGRGRIRSPFGGAFVRFEPEMDLFMAGHVVS